MRKEELHNALMHPENLSDEQLIELSETVARFPFFGAAQIALARAYKSRGDIRFADQLSQAAIYTGHRASLYQRLKGIQPSQPQQGLPGKQPSVPVEETTLASIILDKESVVPTPAPNTAEARTSEIASGKTNTDAPDVATTDSLLDSMTGEEATTSIKLSQLDPLEAQFLVTAVNTSIEIEVQPEPIQVPDTLGSGFENPHTIEDDQQVDENSYAALIYKRAQQKKQLPESSSEPISPENEESSELDSEELPAFRSTPLSHGVQRIRSTDAKQHQRDLIDRFIHTEPQIARGKAGDYPTGNLAKESLEDDFSMVTETMAILFAKQGKLDKARKAFRKLMEQHPEKSIYFAAQLKNLDHFKK